MAEMNTGMDPMGPRRVAGGIDHVPGRSSAVSWSAIFAGAWAVASLLIAVSLTSVVGSIVGGVRAGAAVAGGAPSAVATVAESAAGSAATLAAGATDFGEVSNSTEYNVD
jgi:hypothetical protein